MGGSDMTVFFFVENLTLLAAKLDHHLKGHKNDPINFILTSLWRKLLSQCASKAHRTK